MPLESCSTLRLSRAHLWGNRRRVRVKEVEVRNEEVKLGKANEKESPPGRRFSTLKLKSNDRFLRAREWRAFLLFPLHFFYPPALFVCGMRFPSSPFYASFVARVASTAISSARGAISTGDFHTLLVERLDKRSIGIFRSSVGSKRGHVVREKQHMARQADLPFPWDTNGSYNDWTILSFLKSRYVHATLYCLRLLPLLLRLCTEYLRRTKRIVTPRKSNDRAMQLFISCSLSLRRTVDQSAYRRRKRRLNKSSANLLQLIFVYYIYLILSNNNDFSRYQWNVCFEKSREIDI